jgi:two-component system alkaline phosphatase synthesis response regulator PhoP
MERNPRTRKILIIDDNPAVCSMLEMLLRENGYKAISCQDGLDGLYKARQEKPDLILLDVMLPGMDGFKVCRMIKFDQQLKAIPVVILTSRMGEEDREIGYQCGADAYVVKATRVSSILEEIRKLLN